MIQMAAVQTLPEKTPVQVMVLRTTPGKTPIPAKVIQTLVEIIPKTILKTIPEIILKITQKTTPKIILKTTPAHPIPPRIYREMILPRTAAARSRIMAHPRTTALAMKPIPRPGI